MASERTANSWQFAPGQTGQEALSYYPWMRKPSEKKSLKRMLAENKPDWFEKYLLRGQQLGISPDMLRRLMFVDILVRAVEEGNEERAKTWAHHYRKFWGSLLAPAGEDAGSRKKS